MNDSATIFIAEPQEAKLDCEGADEALETVAQIGGGCPTLMYNSYCFTCDNEPRSTELVIGQTQTRRPEMAMSASPPRKRTCNRHYCAPRSNQSRSIADILIFSFIGAGFRTTSLYQARSYACGSRSGGAVNCQDLPKPEQCKMAGEPNVPIRRNG